MIRHILKIIWNERRVNSWIMLEYLIVFCVLWFCCDYLYFLGKSYLEYPGHDSSHTYLIRMGKKDIPTPADETPEAYIALFAERVKHFPGVESIAFSANAVPSSPFKSANGYLAEPDSTYIVTWHKMITPGFFDVYRMKLQSGRTYNENDMITRNALILSPDRNGNMGEFGMASLDVNKVKALRQGDTSREIVGVYEKTKSNFFDAFGSTTYELFPPDGIDLSAIDISIRIKADEDNNVVERFMHEMREPLFIGPYFLTAILPSEMLEKAIQNHFIEDNLNSVLAITGFLLLNIFLALIGTFWFRTQSRRSEIGLRIAMGASKRNVRNMMFTETTIMLFITSVFSTYICINLAQTELLSSLGIPLADRGAAGIGEWQDVINYIITFSIMLIVSCLAVWYPARQSSDIAPAEALRDE